MAINLNGTGSITGLSSISSPTISGGSFPAGTAAAPGITLSGDSDTGLYSPGANQIAITTSGTAAVTVDASQRVGIGTSSVGAIFQTRVAADKNIAFNLDSNSEARISCFNDAISASAPLGFNGTDLRFQTGNTERGRFDSSGRLLVGTSSATTGSGSNANLQIEHPSSAPQFYINNGNSTINSGAAIGEIKFHGKPGGSYAEFARILVAADGATGSGDAPGRLVFSTCASGASSPTERMRISNNGKFTLNTVTAVNNGTEAWRLNCGANDFCARFFGVTGGNESQTNTALGISKDNSTNRSINAGGTVNANGADYAEYMVKDGNFVIAKGDICGINADGRLTNVFADAVSFVVKSTNPSYVGGDTWGTEDAVGPKPDENDTDALAQWEANLETARQAVDRIAFAGQVPVNVTGATAGQYIVPFEDNGSISGIAKDESNLTLTEYMRSVGKVVAVEDDGRARIIVKVA